MKGGRSLYTDYLSRVMTLQRKGISLGLRRLGLSVCSLEVKALFLSSSGSAR